MTDLAGKEFGMFTVLSYHCEIKGDRKWMCQCRCGTIKPVRENEFRYGRTKSCGCLTKQLQSESSKKKVVDLLSKRFDRLVVIERDGSTKYQKAMWKCLCDCGKFVTVVGASLLSGNTKSCGCIHKEVMHTLRFNPNLSKEEREKGRDSDFNYWEWRKSVYTRDGYTCQICGQKKSGTLVAHHKDGYSNTPARRCDVTNGVTLCTSCHDEYHEAFGYVGSTEQRWNEYLLQKKGDANE